VSKQIVVLLKGGNWLPIIASGEILSHICQQLSKICAADVRPGGISDGAMQWGFRNDELAAFYVRDYKPVDDDDLRLRSILATEKLASVAEREAQRGDEWRDDA
jgi:hypothetical protein